MAQHLMHPREHDKTRKCFGRGRTGDQQIHVADGLATPAHTAGDSHLLHSGQFGQVGGHFLGLIFCEVEQETPGAAAILLDAPEYFLFELGAHAGQGAQLLLFADTLQVVHRAHAEMFDQQRDALGPQPLDLQKLKRGGRVFFEQLIASLEGPTQQQFSNDGRNAFANARNVGQFAFGVTRNVGNSLRQAFDGSCGVSIAADPERIFRPDLHEVRRFRKDSRDLYVLHLSLSIFALMGGSLGRCDLTWGVLLGVARNEARALPSRPREPLLRSPFG